jgi:putative hemin transport protein
MSEANQTVRAAFATMRREGPRRHRDIAKILSISEAELLAAHCGPIDPDETLTLEVTLLNTQWPEQISSIAALGSVMALTRNTACVHEKIGIYSPVSQTGDIGLVTGEAIDLRLFYKNWYVGFAVIEQTARGVQHSLQFFDQGGVAIHKIFLRPESQSVAFEEIKHRFAAALQTPMVSMSPYVGAKPERNDAEIDIPGLQKDWYAMRDTHDFFLILKKHNVSRLQAFRLIGAAYAQQVKTGDFRRVLGLASDKKIPIMVFVSNSGVIQIHTGIISNISVTQGWLNVLDSDFNLHLRQDCISSAWIVRKPTVDGVVTSLELFDHGGEVITMIFGQRKPDLPENIQWRALMDELSIGGRVCAA